MAESEKVKGWSVAHIHEGGVMDEGLKIRLGVVGHEDETRNLFLPAEEINNTILLMTKLRESAYRLRVKHGHSRPNELQAPTLEAEQVTVASTTDGSQIAIVIQDADGSGYGFQMPVELAQSVAEGLNAALQIHGHAPTQH